MLLGMAARQVIVVAFPGVQSLDVSGPVEVFAGAQRLLERSERADRGYRVRLASRDGAALAASSGLTLVPQLALRALSGPVDTLIVAGGEGSRAAAADPELVAWLRQHAPRARRVASVCTGAFVLAAAGLLDGRRVTTHWASCAALARLHPDVHVESDPIYLRDGSVWTSAGVTAGMDLALALVEEDLGREAALTVARWLVMFLRRPGNQSQFSAQLDAQLADRDSLRELQAWLPDHLNADLSVETMARHAGMSPRHFARSFRHQVGVTPARYVERARLEAARRRLEESADPVERVAAACGFGTAETMRRAFLRTLGVGPAEYRRRFHSPQPTR
jgi:transcriptional regulator GlxA family with amidase domain